MSVLKLVERFIYIKCSPCLFFCLLFVFVLLVWVPLPSQVEMQIVGELARKGREKIVQA